jgi:hypothetical protein
MMRIPRGDRLLSRLIGLAAAITLVIAILLVLSAVGLLPQLRDPFAETTTDRSQPVLLKSITALSRYEAASGSFQVVVDLSRQTAFLPSFIEGSQTLFIGQGNEIAFVDFSHLSGRAIKVSRDRTVVTVSLPDAQLEPAVLNVRQSYVYAQQQGLLNRIGNFFAGNPNSQQQVYILAQQKIETAARQSPLLAQAQKNTMGMLEGMLTSLGFRQVTVTFGAASRVSLGRTGTPAAPDEHGLRQCAGPHRSSIRKPRWRLWCWPMTSAKYNRRTPSTTSCWPSPR